MKTFIKKATFLFYIVAFYGCDKIDKPYDVPDVSGQSRKVIVEDFTGHTCGNCPEAAKTAEQLKELYGDNLIIIGVHSGGFAKPKTGYPDNRYSTDFRTEAGNTYNEEWKVDVAGNPNGLVSRRKINDNYIINPNNWSAAIEEIRALPVILKMELTVTYDSISRILEASVKAQSTADINGSHKLVICITEDKIIDWQKDYSMPIGQEDVPNYEHNHVLRGTITDKWGEELFAGSFPTGSLKLKTINNYTLNTNWNADNCHVIAYVYDATTYEIIQAEEIKLIP